MPLVSNAGNKQVNVGKMQIKGATMATSYQSPPQRKGLQAKLGLPSAWKRGDPLGGSHGDDPPNKCNARCPGIGTFTFCVLTPLWIVIQEKRRKNCTIQAVFKF